MPSPMRAAHCSQQNHH